MKDESIVVLGNGGSLIDKNLGNKIDSFDKVIRFNNWKTRFYEKDVGTKTDIWITYNPEKQFTGFYNDYKRFNLTDGEIKEILSSVKEIWYISWLNQHIYESWKNNIILKRIGLYDDTLKRHISSETVEKYKDIIPIPSTGIASILVLLEMYSHLYIGGFDFWGTLIPTKYQHYYKDGINSVIDTNEKVLASPRGYVKGGFVHNPDLEASLITKFVKEGRIIFLDDELEINKSKFTGNTKEFVCNKCNKVSRLYSWENDICNYCEGI